MLLAVVHWVSDVKLIFILAFYIYTKTLNTTLTPRAERKARMAMASHF